MKLPCRYVLTFNQILGIILTSFSFGLLIASLMYWWKYVIAFITLILGFILIFKK